MNLAYDLRVSTMPATGTELVRLGGQIRAAETKGDKAKAGELWTAFAVSLEKSTTLSADERGPLLERARKLAGGAGGGASLSAEDRKAFDAASEGAKSAKHADRIGAAKAIDALLAAHPNDTSLKSASGAIYANAGAFTKAEAILQDPAAKARVVASRRFYGLPADAARFQITPDLEPEYVALFEDAHDALTKNQTKPLAAKAAAGLKRFPGAPGLLALACAADLKAGKKPAAKKKCDAALAAWDETVLGHFFAGQLDPSEAGTKHLQRVLELDPTLEAQVKPLLDQRKKKPK
jgi:predicted Zn-dependent protease